MTRKRRAYVWLPVAALLFAVVVGLASRQAFSRRAALPVVRSGEELHDAVAVPPGAVRIAFGKPVPSAYFVSPSSRRAALDRALLSRRR